MATTATSSTEGMLQVRQFFQNKNILLTGVTGFMGKVLLEKILRNVNPVGKLFILIRKKRNATL